MMKPSACLALSMGLMLAACADPPSRQTEAGQAVATPVAASPLEADYCDTQNAITGAPMDDTYSAQVEARVRAKCKVGDIIWVDFGDNIGRLCDLSKPVVTAGRGGVCYLAKPRRSY